MLSSGDLLLKREKKSAHKASREDRIRSSLDENVVKTTTEQEEKDNIGSYAKVLNSISKLSQIIH
jgi:hypothetical protein